MIEPQISSDGYVLPNEAATVMLAERLAAALDHGMVVYLHGPLGAGKTSFCRALLMALGAGERIKSPTYSLIEGYTVQGRPAWHLDLYRIADPAELEWLGLDALGDPAALVLVEWPEHGIGALPAADMECQLNYLDAGRVAQFTARTVRGRCLLERLVRS